MSQTVADILVGTLEQVGVKHIFGLIGDSLNPLADAVRRSCIEWACPLLVASPRVTSHASACREKEEKSPQGRRDAARGDRYAGGGTPALHTILPRGAAAVCSAF